MRQLGFAAGMALRRGGGTAYKAADACGRAWANSGLPWVSVRGIGSPTHGHTYVCQLVEKILAWR